MKRKSRTSNRISARTLPLSGIRVLDLTRILSGPFCTMKLGDMGAEIIKIEQPGIGDETRKWGPPFVKSESAYFLSVNRNKKSVTLNLKSRAGKEIIRKLIKQCDVLVENFRAGVMESLGLSYRAVKKINPRMVYCSISGYGQTSSRSHQPSYDLIVQGESGLMDVTGFPDGPPTKAGISLADVNAGNLAFEGILLALFQRERTGEGQHIDISLLDGLLSLFTYQSQIALSSKNSVMRKGNRHPTIMPYETFATKDGYINIAVATESQWKSFCLTIRKSKLVDDKRFATNSLRVQHRAALERILVPIIKAKRSVEWIKRFSKADVPVGNINTVAEALNLPTILERSIIAKLHHPTVGILSVVGNPINISGSKRTRLVSPPFLGQHTEEVLNKLGYTGSEIRSLRDKGVI